MRLCPLLEGKPQTELNLPRVVELAVQHAKRGWALKIQPPEISVLAGIAELHMVERVEELSVEGEPGTFGDCGPLGDGKVQVPAVLPVERPEIIGPAVTAQDYRPELVIRRGRIGKDIDPGAAVARIAVAAD